MIPPAFSNHAPQLNAPRIETGSCPGCTRPLRIFQTTAIRFGIFWAVLLSTGVGFLSADEIDFNRDIRPILSDRCFKCHGPDENSRESDLRLDQRKFAEYALTGESLKDIEASQRIHSDDPYTQMPPPESKLSLSPQEIELLDRWMKAGSPYDSHWAFERPIQSPLPAVQNTRWPMNEIDFFVLAKLEAEGLAPNPAATRERLIRRVSFDLTGLPPSLEEIDAFVNDSSPDAYEKVVDRLLSRKEFGERMTSEWLDVARYSDSFGYQVDRGRHVWPWRDWVIRSFNNNLSYDKFITDQLAGDQLPDATDDQILATAFNRLHPQKVEGGSVPEEFRVEYVADRSHTFATAFLGLTLECARCHDHKYDPISQTEYYQLFAYFNNIDEAGLYSYFTNSTPTPTLIMANEAEKERRQETRDKIAELESKLTQMKANPRDFEKWFADRSTVKPTKPIEHLTFEDFKGGRNKSVKGAVGQAVELTGDDAVGLKTGNFSRNQPFSVSLWMYTPDEKERAVIFHRSRAWTDAGSRGYQLLLEEGRLSASLIHFWPGNAIRVKTTTTIPTNKWIHVAMTYDGSSRANGLRLWINGKPAGTETIRDNLYKNITGGGGNNIAIGERFRDRGFTRGRVDEFKVFDRELVAIEIEGLFEPMSFERAKTVDAKAASSDLIEKWKKFYLQHVSPSTLDLKKELLAKRNERSKQIDGSVEVMVMKDRPTRRATFRLNRGMYNQPREPVSPGIPAIFGANSKPQSRLELAEWLTGPENPLTARVTVNRYWQLIFGDGLVRTPEDFGSQGQPPTHAQLLDWLAVDFQKQGWDLKRLLKQMVMSATYRQDSKLTESIFRKDPSNRLLGRASSFRQPAEMLRDNALKVSGLLSTRTGGGGAKPYDLALSFKPIGPDKGEGLYRRSVYTYWKRTGPSPVMMTLDAAKRDVCTVKRERTATPLQAFVLLNDPQFVEASRVLAENLLLDSKQTPDQLVRSAFRILTSRRPNTTELKILSSQFQSQFEHFEQDTNAAKQYLAIGQREPNDQLDPVRLAALTTVVQTIMNFDECLMRR